MQLIGALLLSVPIGLDAIQPGPSIADAHQSVVIDTMHTPTAGDKWRIPERDAANCLYFLLRFHGIGASYADVVQAIGRDQRVSLHTLSVAANQLGLASGVYEATPEFLGSLHEPVIAFTEDGTLGDGGFVVVLYMDASAEADSDMQVLAGGIALLRMIPTDEFRRSWSGHILMRRPDGTRSLVSWCLAGVSAGLLGGMVVVWWRIAARVRADRPCCHGPTSGETR